MDSTGPPSSEKTRLVENMELVYKGSSRYVTFTDDINKEKFTTLSYLVEAMKDWMENNRDEVKVDLFVRLKDKVWDMHKYNKDIEIIDQENYGKVVNTIQHVINKIKSFIMRIGFNREKELQKVSSEIENLSRDFKQAIDNLTSERSTIKDYQNCIKELKSIRYGENIVVKPKSDPRLLFVTRAFKKTTVHQDVLPEQTFVGSNSPELGYKTLNDVKSDLVKVENDKNQIITELSRKIEDTIDYFSQQPEIKNRRSGHTNQELWNKLTELDKSFKKMTGDADTKITPKHFKAIIEGLKEINKAIQKIATE